MKIFLLLLLTIAGLTQTTKADTIDYWHVYYNKIKIKEFNQYGSHEIIIKTVKRGDAITVKYYRDTPCFDCPTHIVIEDGKHNSIFTCSGKGTGNPISFSVTNLLEYKKRSGCNYFEIFYADNAISSTTSPRLLFSIKFE